MNKQNDVSADGVYSLALLPMALAQFRVDPASPFPIYEQICQCIRTAIADGELPAGTMLPPARLFAERLQVGRNTVVAAYSRLAAEGYVTSNTRRGTRVADNQILHASTGTAEGGEEEEPVPSRDMPARTLSFHALRWLQSPQETTVLASSHAVSMPDPSLYPRVSLARLLTEEFSRPLCDASSGIEQFQIAVSSLLRQMRGIRCAPAQIVPIAHPAQALELVSRLMLDPGDTVYAEQTIEPTVRMALQAAGAQLVYMPSDRHGADIRNTNGPPPRLIVVSPSANFPFGRQMSEMRRKAVLDRAEAHGAAVLEWDRCWGLSYTGGRSGALEAQARQTAVVYFDSFYETLGAHLRLGYLAVPQFLAQPFQRMAGLLTSAPPAFVLSGVARFIEGHHFNVHLSELRKAYAQRLRRLSDLCRVNLRNAVVIEPNAGYTLAIEFPDALDDVKVCRLAGANLPIAPLSQFYCGRPGPTGVVIGAGAMTERMIEILVRQIAEAVRQVRGEMRATDAGSVQRPGDDLAHRTNLLEMHH